MPDPVIPAGRGGPQHIPRPESWRLGSRSPWADVHDRELSLDVLAERLVGREPKQLMHPWRQAAGPNVSAVLAAVFEGLDGAPAVILTKRAAQMRSHRGELSFPGGRRDDEDADVFATALREAHEEIALLPSDVQILGQLDRFVTGGSNSLVHPIVGVLPEHPRSLVANPAEVEEILLVPVADLLHPDAWREELWDRNGHTAVLSFFELPGHTLWGATAAMVRQLFTVWMNLADPALD